MLQWARDEFELLFHNNPEELVQYLSQPGYVATVKAQRSTSLERLGTILNGLTKDLPKCVACVGCPASSPACMSASSHPFHASPCVVSLRHSKLMPCTHLVAAC